MKIFVTNNFTGRWPVGTAAIVIAETKLEAELAIAKELNSIRLKWDGKLTEIGVDQQKVIILNDGDY